jgi:hypothetical protein
MAKKQYITRLIQGNYPNIPLSFGCMAGGWCEREGCCIRPTDPLFPQVCPHLLATVTKNGRTNLQSALPPGSFG